MAQHHNMYGTPTYKSWSEIKYRCGNPRRPDYVNISYCKSWEDFRNFLKDMGIRPNGTSIDRIDGAKGYYKDNCRWATNHEQAINRKTTHYFEYKNKKLTLSDWSKITGIKRSTLAQRIYCYRWNVEKALTTGGNFGTT